MLLLDTYTLIGVVSEPARLSTLAKSLIEDAANRLFVSSFSALEVVLAVQKNRLKLQVDPTVWFERALAEHGIEPVDVNWRIAAASVTLPRRHADPADRIIIATAIIEGLTLLTPDPKIHEYTEATVRW